MTGIPLSQFTEERICCGQKWSRCWPWAECSSSCFTFQRCQKKCQHAMAVVTQSLFTEPFFMTLGFFSFLQHFLALPNGSVTSWMRWANLEQQLHMFCVSVAISLKYHFCNSSQTLSSTLGFLCSKFELSAGFHRPFQLPAYKVASLQWDDLHPENMTWRGPYASSHAAKATSRINQTRAKL